MPTTITLMVHIHRLPHTERIRHQAAIRLRLATIRMLHITTGTIMAVILRQDILHQQGIRTRHLQGTLRLVIPRPATLHLVATLTPTLLQAIRRRMVMGLHRRATVSLGRPGMGRTSALVGQMMTGRAEGATTTAAKVKAVAGVSNADGRQVASGHQGEVAEMLRAQSGRKRLARRQARISV